MQKFERAFRLETTYSPAQDDRGDELQTVEGLSNVVLIGGQKVRHYKIVDKIQRPTMQEPSLLNGYETEGEDIEIQGHP